MAQKSKSLTPKPPRRDHGEVSDAFALDVPFGGQQVGLTGVCWVPSLWTCHGLPWSQVKFWLKSDPDSPILSQPQRPAASCHQLSRELASKVQTIMAGL